MSLYNTFPLTTRDFSLGVAVGSYKALFDEASAKTSYILSQIE